MDIIPVIFAIAAVAVFAVNVNMAAIFAAIRNARNRKLKIRLAKLSRVLMQLHIPFAAAGTLLIVVHAAMMLARHADTRGLDHPKLVTGLVAIAALAVTLIGGYRRKLRATGFRRKFHLGAALVFAAAILAHTLTRFP